MTVEAQFGIAKGGYRGAPTMGEVIADLANRNTKALSWNEIYILNYDAIKSNNERVNSGCVKKRKL